MAGQEEPAEAEDVAELGRLAGLGLAAGGLELGDPALDVPDEGTRDRVGRRQAAMGQGRHRLIADAELQISAAAIKCLGGALQGKLWPRNDDERRSLIDGGFDLDRVLTVDDLVQGDDVFVAATGVTSGALLRGVRVVGDRVETESIVMRSRSGTFRRIVASHPLTKIQSLMKGAP